MSNILVVWLTETNQCGTSTGRALKREFLEMFSRSGCWELVCLVSGGLLKRTTSLIPTFGNHRGEKVAWVGEAAGLHKEVCVCADDMSVVNIYTIVTYTRLLSDTVVRVTLTCYNCREYGRCAQPQETPIHLSKERTTMRACLQELRSRTHAATADDDEECEKQSCDDWDLPDHRRGYTHSKPPLNSSRISRRSSNSAGRQVGSAGAFSPGACGMDCVLESWKQCACSQNHCRTHS